MGGIENLTTANLSQETTLGPFGIDRLITAIFDREIIALGQSAEVLFPSGQLFDPATQVLSLLFGEIFC